MKKYVCRLMVLAVMVLAVCAEGFADVEIDATNFPDANFRSYVSSNFDTNNDGSLSSAEIASVTNVGNHNISSSLKGIEYFTALISLICSGNQLTELDISNNTALTHLLCHDTQLTTLDVSKNTALTALYCYNNHITTLDVSKNTALTRLYCYNNHITTLDVSKNTALTHLYCDFTITSADNTFEFNIADFMEAYKSLDNGLSSVDFRYYYDSEYSNLTLNPEQIAANNVVSFTIPEGKTFSYIYMTLTYSNSSNKIVYVYPFSGSSSATTDSDSSDIAPIITTSSLPFASVDVPYSATLSALGSTPITWTLASGDLPTGLTLSSSGTISGTPTTPGASSFTVTATNSAGSTSRLFTIIIPFTAHRSPKITTDFLNTAYTNSPYGFKLTASGTTPLIWSLAQNSSLPDGLTLTTSGYIYGTPTSADTTNFTIYVSNSAGITSEDFSLTICEAPQKHVPLSFQKTLTPLLKVKPTSASSLPWELLPSRGPQRKNSLKDSL